MTESDRISVIIPVYKVEKYLDRCIQSVVSQTYHDLEIILVDDGSPDRCGKICDEWAEKDGRIKVIHKKNGGLSDARNAGLDIASGSLIGFVDSDDYIHPEMYQRLYETLINQGADLAVCGLYRIRELDGEIVRSEIPCKDQVIDSREALRNTCYSACYMSVWNKLYRRTLFSCNRFLSGKISEDIFIMPGIYSECTKIALLSSPYYFYVQTPNSICRSALKVKNLDSVEAYYNMLLFCERNGYPDLLQEISAKMTDLFIWQRNRIHKIEPSEKKRFREIKSMVRYGYLRYGKQIRAVHKINIEFPAFYSFLLRLKRNVQESVPTRQSR